MLLLLFHSSLMHCDDRRCSLILWSNNLDEQVLLLLSLSRLLFNTPILIDVYRDSSRVLKEKFFICRSVFSCHSEWVSTEIYLCRRDKRKEKKKRRRRRPRWILFSDDLRGVIRCPSIDRRRSSVGFGFALDDLFSAAWSDDNWLFSMLKRLRSLFGSTTSEQSFTGRPASSSKLLVKEETPFNQWKLIKELGDGAFGKVYQAFNDSKEQSAAVKVIEDATDENLPEHLVEIDILKDCQQKNIIEFYESYLYEKNLYIFLEFCTFGAVDHLISVLEHGLDEKQIRFIANELLQALDYLHRERFVIHRDIKASNVLLTHDGQVKLADFGVSIRNTSAEQKINEYIGTVYW